MTNLFGSDLEKFQLLPLLNRLDDVREAHKASVDILSNGLRQFDDKEEQESKEEELKQIEEEAGDSLPMGTKGGWLSPKGVAGIAGREEALQALQRYKESQRWTERNAALISDKDRWTKMDSSSSLSKNLLEIITDGSDGWTKVDSSSSFSSSSKKSKLPEVTPKMLTDALEKGLIETDIRVPRECFQGLQKSFVSSQILVDNAKTDVDLLKLLPVVLQDLIFTKNRAEVDPFAEALFYRIKDLMSDVGFKCGWHRGTFLTSRPRHHAEQWKRPPPTIELRFHLEFGVEIPKVIRSEAFPQLSIGDPSTSGDNLVHISGVPIEFNPLNSEPARYKYIRESSFQDDSAGIKPPVIPGAPKGKPMVFTADKSDPLFSNGRPRTERLYAIRNKAGEIYPAMGTTIGPIPIVVRFRPAAISGGGVIFYLLEIWVDVSLTVVPNGQFKQDEYLSGNDRYAVKQRVEVVTTTIERYRISRASHEMLTDPNYILPAEYKPSLLDRVFEWNIRKPLDTENLITPRMNFRDRIPPISGLFKPYVKRSILRRNGDVFNAIPEASYYAYVPQHYVGWIGSTPRLYGGSYFIPPRGDGGTITDAYINGNATSPRRRLSSREYGQAYQYLVALANFRFVELHLKIANVPCDQEEGGYGSGMSNLEQQDFVEMQSIASQVTPARDYYVDRNRKYLQNSINYWNEKVDNKGVAQFISAVKTSAEIDKQRLELEDKKLMKDRFLSA
eukprot:Nk52_evm1s792 gene=Nk52_evmTU1s792